MLSLEYLDLVSTIAWKLFEKVSNFQRRFWLNTPVYWNSKTKKAAYKPIKKCIPLLLLSLLQIPTYIYSWLILYWQFNPKYAHPDFPFNGTVLMAFGSVMNFFISWGSLSNFHKRKEWTLCLNVVAERHFRNRKKNKRKKSLKKSLPFLKGWSLGDLIAEGIFIFFLFLGSVGFLFPFVLNGDPISYIFIDLPRSSREWYIIKFAVRPLYWGMWAFYSTWTFYAVVQYIFFAILHGSMIVPRVPQLHLREKLIVIHNSFENFTFSQRLVINFMKGAYRDYREFQIFMRPANEAMFVVVPDGLSGIGCVSVIGGFATIKGYDLFPLNLYLIFPSVFIMTSVLICIMVPIACNILESALGFKHYWLSKFTRKLVRKRLTACRPMGIAAGPFGYVQRSLPMEMMNAIVDSVCSLTMSMDI